MTSHFHRVSLQSQIIRPIVNKTRLKYFSTVSSRWDLYAGIVVERRPVVTPKKHEMQEKYMEMLRQVELEVSKKSDHEIRHQNDLKMLEKVKAGDHDFGNVQTARDDEDKWTVEAKKFIPAERETDADRKKDIKSLERALDSHLLLVVEQKLGNEYKWICPHSKLADGETLRQAAERMLRETFPDMKTRMLGNAPWGFYKYKYPRSLDNSKPAVGAKVFFCKAQVISGESNIDQKNQFVRDFVWLKREELHDKLLPEYHKKLSDCLVDELIH